MPFLIKVENVVSVTCSCATLGSGRSQNSFIKTSLPPNLLVCSPCPSCKGAHRCFQFIFKNLIDQTEVRPCANLSCLWSSSVSQSVL
ncbi:unnamed protein product [Moneuplotes crassus]|uniref:Uncharacterized protein n=1 Tax=Euplotes crassus TaxID=5936 RepID=A0AAD1Y1Y8_EUPCR|nr:unnamed protein product [Moneuplotes crassus]